MVLSNAIIIILNSAVTLCSRYQSTVQCKLVPSGRGWRGTWPRGHAHGAQPPSMKQAPGLGGDKKVADDAKKQTMHDDQACIMYRTGMYSNHPALYFLLIYYCRCDKGEAPRQLIHTTCSRSG